jgi:hypothetical protein
MTYTSSDDLLVPLNVASAWGGAVEMLAIRTLLKLLVKLSIASASVALSRYGKLRSGLNKP